MTRRGKQLIFKEFHRKIDLYFSWPREDKNVESSPGYITVVEAHWMIYNKWVNNTVLNRTKKKTKKKRRK